MLQQAVLLPKFKPTIDLTQISEEELLNLRLCDLPITIPGTWLEGCIEELGRELEAKGLLFKPVCYLADEWLTPQNEPVIGIPFYLAHPRLIQLEKSMMLEAEGETQPWCLRLLRHETGHAICYAYGLHKKKKWQKIFGSSAKEYPDTYRFRPYSKNYVRHLENYYAQYHPDEDFVETFAVWLTPQMDWNKQYQGWGALKKLKFVDELMQGIQGKPPLVKSGTQHWKISSIKTTLKNFYKKKKQFWAEDFPDFHDVNLKKMFTPLGNDLSAGSPPEIARVLGAARTIEKYRPHILNNVSFWTGEKKYLIDDLIKKIIQRCQELKLVTSESEPLVVLRISTYITTLVMNYQYTGWFRGKKRKV